MFARIRSRCKAVTDGVTRGMAQRYGDTMGEASVETSVQHGPGRIEAITHAKLRIHEDGSGLFVLQRGKDEIAIRWTAEVDPEQPETLSPLELFAKFGDLEGVLVADDAMSEEYKRGFRDGSLAVAQAVHDGDLG